MKRYEWELKSGKKAVLEAEYSECVEDRVLDADGLKVVVGKEIKTRAVLSAYIDGQEVGTCELVDFWRIIDTMMPGVKRIWGIESIGFTAERAAEIEHFLKSVIEAGRDPQAQAIRAEDKAKEKERQIKHYEALLAQASNSHIYTRAEAAAARQRWIDVQNEGGEGYVPHFWTDEEVEDIKKKLEDLKLW